jgi:hypothetical protein
MSARRKHAPKTIMHQPVAQRYARFLAGIKERIRTTQVKAALAANTELEGLLILKFLAHAAFFFATAFLATVTSGNSTTRAGTSAVPF